MHRKWIILTALIVTALVAGCKKKTPPPPPPPPTPPAAVETPRGDDVEPNATLGTAEDTTPTPTPKSIQDIDAELRNGGLVGDVFFDFDKFSLRSDARARLDKNAEFMKSDRGSDLVFTIEGHCDERGTNEYNLALGQNRSTSAVDYLVSQGVSRSRFKTISYGEEKPFCRESTEACWQQNRRARFVVTARTGG